MSLEINNISTPQNATLKGIAARQSQLHIGGYPLVSKLPEYTPSVSDTSLSSSTAMREFVVAAKNAASGLGNSDPMKPFAEGLVNELDGAKGDVFNAMGRMNELQNALTFALHANAGLSANPSLQAIA